MSKKQDEGTTRRDFLKLAGTAAPAAAAAAALTGTAAEADTAIEETRIQDTTRTRAYLDSARF